MEAEEIDDQGGRSSEMSSEREDTSGNHSEGSPAAADTSVAGGDEKKDEDVSDVPKKDDQKVGEQTSSNPVLSRKARLERLRERRVSCW